MNRTTPDYAAIRRHLEGKQGVHYWRSLEELTDDPAFERFIEVEFPDIAPQMDRRRFLQLMGASLALGGLAACGPTPGTAVPYVAQPEIIVPGKALWYATAVQFTGYAQPVLGCTHVGRPTKLEGSPEHPASQGACDAFTQAALLQLYDPDRSQAPRFKGVESSWDAFESDAATLQAECDHDQGQGLHILMGASSSPSLQRQLEKLIVRWPKASLYRFEPFEEGRYGPARLAFGRPVEIHYLLQNADLVLSLEDDFLGAGPKQTSQARAWANRRQAAARGDGESRLVMVQASPTLTGANATETRRVQPAQLPALVRALAAALGEGSAAPLAAPDQQWVEAMAAALQSRRGRCLIVAGPHTPADVQAAVHRLNQRLDNVGRTVGYTAPVLFTRIGEAQLGDILALTQAIHNAQVRTLVMLDTNPAYSAPGDLYFREALEKVPTRIHAGLYYDETGARSHWHLCASHSLDGWGDARAVDGSVCISQPLVQPFYGTRTLVEIVAMLAGELSPDGHALVRNTWSSLPDDEWRRAVALGFVEGSALPSLQVTAEPVRIADAPAVSGLQVQFRPDPSVWDGRFSNSGWLQELPRPITTLTWDNIIGVSIAVAERYRLVSGDRISVMIDGRSVEGPAWVMPGQADTVVTLFAGYGRERSGRVGNGVGYDYAALRMADSPWLRSGATIARLDQQSSLAFTQMQHTLIGQDVVRHVPRAQAVGPARPTPELPTLYEQPVMSEPTWGMLIDTDQCIGCNACIVACQAENNIAVVGKEQVAKGRVMHWLRVDHYYDGSALDPGSTFLPVPCMHCEKAPCEVGCPVNATVHGADGLNEMVYNRCIGTRTCSSYCPYKVRRFNWYNWTENDEPSIQAARNPNVTVRSRGVMEKCTYCVQRISEARIAARKDGRPIAEGEIQTACQQTCPVQAIHFGDLSKKDSAVNKAKDSIRHYALLEELNTRPKTTYLAAIRDQKPGEEKA
ncbi:TAT-variant-translocated molybdopterin oxidoreductase [Pseudomonas corrugata]|uniref:TAT-variant-translocated molybdopterin oxidoreductase n=1 Tax=Pseudomonas corrugata TaxID=47879 RepID=UPI0028C4AA9D|nr:TAT-variant-translocated molybdopterin oxidoreductase [Pseudomonas corrugata]MDU9025161.1 TAT-variant-translocated molybdopterin oxidoreductase [Pseudomonas corrugata]